MYRRNARGWAKHLDFIVFDCICLELSLLIAYLIRSGSNSTLDFHTYIPLFGMMFLIDFFVILCLDTMKNVLKRGYYREFVYTVWQSLVVCLCTTAYFFFTKEGSVYSRITIALMTVFYFFSSYGVRVLWKKHIHNKMKDSNDRSLLIMASEATTPMILHEILANNFSMHKVVGLVLHDDYKVGRTIEGIPVVATYDTILKYVVNHWVDEVLLSLNPNEPIPENTIDSLAAMGVTVHVRLDQSARRVGMKQTIGNIGGLPVITTAMNSMSPRQYVFKRAMDICGGLVGCFFTLIIIIFIGPMIKKESPGPIFFTQIRIGKNGRKFKIYKFRSMYMDAEERKKELMEQNRIKDGLMFKMEFDPRIIGNYIDENGKEHTGIGEFIRKYSLDEFPQFFNVLKGDMSLVGTRPPVESEYELYQQHHKARLATRPGITGMWQVSGRSNILDFEEVVKLDTEYINNWSVGLDIKILFKTVMVVLKKEGSM